MIHKSALDGFGNQSNPYNTGRPDYPEAITNWLRNTLHLVDGATVVDLGAGTGKFIPSLFSAGAQVIAVEPVKSMRDQLAKRFPMIDIQAGDAEHLPLETSSVAAVTCAQSFHWFATRAALQEIHRVLQPAGVLALVWNVRDEEVHWVAELTEIMRPFEGDTPRYHTQQWRKLFPADGFGPLEEHRFPHQHVGPVDQVVLNRVLSISFIAALPPSEQNGMKERVQQLIDRTAELAGKRQVSFPYHTMAFSCRKIA